jgi:hypothetical protein
VENDERPNYGNWIPRKMTVVFLIFFCISCVLSILIDISIIREILIAFSVLFGALFVYMSYAYWLLWKSDGGLQKELCNALLDKLEWDGQGKALDIGTGSGRVAIYLAKNIHRRVLWALTTGEIHGRILRPSATKMLKLKA